MPVPSLAIALRLRMPSGQEELRLPETMLCGYMAEVVKCLFAKLLWREASFDLLVYGKRQ